ncbi:hypothetical protein DB346_05985 [Verrucomicrobia bacterium LW23]|nr:hypothetical protein DB346_05985 [Verrucomicrobia bacterium LW23]
MSAPVSAADRENAATLVARFGEAAGMPFLKLDDQGSAAAMLEGGLYFELQYTESSQRLFLCVEFPGTGAPDTLETEQKLLSLNIQLMARYGFALARAQMGDSRLFLVASLRLEGLDVELLGATATELVEVVRRHGNASLSAAGAPASSDFSTAEPLPEMSNLLDLRHLLRPM